MPFKSQAQRRKFAEMLVRGEISAETFEEWNRETGDAKLPERVTTKRPAKRAPAKRAKKRTAAKRTTKKRATRRQSAKKATGRKRGSRQPAVARSNQ